MFTHARPLAVLLFSFALTACADDGLGPMSAGVDERTCHVSIERGVFSYRVLGDVMELMVDGRREQVTRVGSGTGRAGHWLVKEGPVEHEGRVVDVRSTMKLNVNSLTFSVTCTDRLEGRGGVASVTVAARVTNNTVEVFESRESIVPF